MCKADDQKPDSAIELHVSLKTEYIYQHKAKMV